MESSMEAGSSTGMAIAMRVTFKTAPFKGMVNFKSKTWSILANLRGIS